MNKDDVKKYIAKSFDEQVKHWEERLKDCSHFDIGELIGRFADENDIDLDVIDGLIGLLILRCQKYSDEINTIDELIKERDGFIDRSSFKNLLWFGKKDKDLK